MNKLQLDLLKNTAEETRNNYTHISYAPKKTWAVYNSKKLDFWLRYCDMISNNMNDDIDEDDIRTFTLTEKLDTDSVPLMADISLRFYNPSDDEEWEPIDARFIREIVRQYQLVIEKLLDIKDNNDDMEFICMVLQSPKYIMEMPVTALGGNNKTEEIVAVDIRLQFPFCRIEPRYHNHIRQYVIKELRHSSIFGRLTESFPIGDWNDIILPFAPNETVAMYGSVKDDAAQKPCLQYQYCYSYLVDSLDEPIYIDENTRYYFGNIPIWEDCYNLTNDNDEPIFLLEGHSDIATGLITKEQLEQGSGISPKKDPKFWLPMITSMHYYNQIVLAKEEVKNRSNAKAKYGTGNKSITRIRMNSDVLNIHRADDTNVLDLCELFLTMIKPHRFAKKNQWLEIGRALYTETRGDDSGLTIWKNYTKAAGDKIKKIPEFFNDIYMETEYITFTDMSISVETLAWYAKHDSPEEYNKWHTQWFTESLKACAEEGATDWKLALAFKRIYWLNIKCTNTKSKHFYVFTRNKWEYIENDSKIDIMLSSEFTKYFATLRHQASEVVLGTKDKHQRKENERIMDEYTKIIFQLECGNRKSSVIKQIANLLYDRDFSTKLDLNPNIIGFGNVVMDTGGDHIEAREGKPQDYVNRCSSVLFNQTMTDDHPLVLEVLDWLHKVYPEESLFRYFMKYAASILKGKNSDKTILIFVGVGNNSKSMIVKLFEAVFGPYCVKVPVSVFTNKRGAGGNASPELAQTAKARIVFLQEPDEDDTFKKGVLKEITGGDSFFARFLHDNGGKMEVLYKLALICNQIPIIEGCDQACRDRISILSHLGRWVKQGYSKDKEEQMLQRLFQMDPMFDFRIPRLACSFLYLMHKWYPIYQKEGLIPPKMMQQVTEDYFNTTDTYKIFIGECLTIDNGEERNKISIREMYEEFKDWYRIVFGTFTKIDRGKFKTEMSNRIGKPVGNYWNSIKMKETGSEENTVRKIESIIKSKKEKTTLKKEVVEQEQEDDNDDTEIPEQEEEPIIKKKIGKLRLNKRSVNRIVEDSIPVI